MHLDDGYLRIGTWNGTQVRVHFTAPILIVALSGSPLPHGSVSRW